MNSTISPNIIWSWSAKSTFGISFRLGSCSSKSLRLIRIMEGMSVYFLETVLSSAIGTTGLEASWKHLAGAGSVMMQLIKSVIMDLRKAYDISSAINCTLSLLTLPLPIHLLRLLHLLLLLLVLSGNLVFQIQFRKTKRVLSSSH